MSSLRLQPYTPVSRYYPHRACFPIHMTTVIALVSAVLLRLAAGRAAGLLFLMPLVVLGVLLHGLSATPRPAHPACTPRAGWARAAVAVDLVTATAAVEVLGRTMDNPRALLQPALTLHTLSWTVAVAGWAAAWICVHRLGATLTPAGQPAPASQEGPRT